MDLLKDELEKCRKRFLRIDIFSKEQFNDKFCPYLCLPAQNQTSEIFRKSKEEFRLLNNLK